MTDDQLVQAGKSVQRMLETLSNTSTGFKANLSMFNKVGKSVSRAYMVEQDLVQEMPVITQQQYDAAMKDTKSQDYLNTIRGLGVATTKFRPSTAKKPQKQENPLKTL